ncbi:MAG: hypothetical protein ABIO76_05610, partial [Ginsengibacter sp.]
ISYFQSIVSYLIAPAYLVHNFLATKPGQQGGIPLLRFPGAPSSRELPLFNNFAQICSFI